MATTTQDRAKTKTGNGCCGQTDCACGGLQCLCRPRFFSGQLLTDEDLIRLENYMVEKNKFHNRFLIGWGVVCGLEVLCSNCNGDVKVTSGYALSPCGEDIVVCADQAVDVCRLIRECKRSLKKTDDCLAPSAQDDCPETEQWVLAVRYKEQSSRGLAALLHKSAPSCCPRCQAGCSSQCGCGCHEQLGGNGCTQPASRDAVAQCEPTITCETYDWVVYKAPSDVPRDPDLGSSLGSGQGQLTERIQHCVDALISAIPPLDGDRPTPEWLCAVKKALRVHFSQTSTTSCTWREQLDAIDVNNSREALTALGILLFEQLFHCVCSALLPPCPEATCDTRVPLAAITIRSRDCSIVRVCNWTTERKMLVSMPTLRYWMSPLGLAKTVREILEWLCCDLLGLRDLFDEMTRVRKDDVPGVRAARGDGEPAGDDDVNDEDAKMKATPKARPFLVSSRQRDVGTLTLENLFQGRATLDAASLLSGLAGGKDEKGQTVMSALERKNLPAFLALNAVAAPHADAVLPDRLKGLRAVLGGVLGKTGAAGGGLDEVLRNVVESMPAETETSAEDLEALRKDLESLRRTIKRQQKRIRDLENK